MLELEQQVRDLVRALDNGFQYAAKVKAIRASLQQLDQDRNDHQDIVERALGRYGSDEIKIDDKTYFSDGDRGCWVMAWIWISKSDEELEALDAKENADD